VGYQSAVLKNVAESEHRIERPILSLYLVDEMRVAQQKPSRYLWYRGQDGLEPEIVGARKNKDLAGK
jgi:Tfp pilus assembly protein PilV